MRTNKMLINDLLYFVMNNEMHVIERDSSHVVIKQYDVCMEYTPCCGTGQFSSAAGDVDVYDYEEYIEQNIIDLAEFKTKFLADQKNKVVAMIRKHAPHTGLSILTAN